MKEKRENSALVQQNRTPFEALKFNLLDLNIKHDKAINAVLSDCII